MTKHAILRYETQGALFHYNFATRQLGRGLSDELFSEGLTLEQTVDKLRANGCYLPEDVPLRKIRNAPVPHAYSAPLKLFIDITNFCNLGCSHCLSSSSSQKHDSLTFETIEDIAKQCEEVGVFYVKIGGGEPLLYPRITNLVDMLNDHSLDVSITTNGTRMTPGMARELRDRNVKMSVSIDGVKETHDAIRGNGVYNKALEALRVMKETGTNVAIRTTLFPSNIPDIPYLVGVAEMYDVPIKIRRAKPSGRATDNQMIMTHPTREYYDLITFLNGYRDRVDIEDIMHTSNEPSKDLIVSNSDCGAATRSIHVDQNGRISPCVFLGDAFVAANLFEGSSLMDAWRKTTQFRIMRTLASDKDCRGCRREAKCHNECPAIKLYATGSLTGKDPSCLKSYFEQKEEVQATTAQST